LAHPETLEAIDVTSVVNPPLEAHSPPRPPRSRFIRASYKTPREWAERFYNVKCYPIAARGGDFPAWEAPAAYAEDLRRYFHAA